MIQEVVNFFQISEGISIFNLIIYAVLIAAYSVFIWKFYKFLARKNIIFLNLTQYNKTKHPLGNKILHSLLFLAEYLIILPVMVVVWFVVLGVFLIILSKEQSVQQILLITAAIISATRITAYISEDLSKDLAKMFPFTMLAIFLLTPNFFLLDQLIPRFLEIVNFFEHILFYLVFVLIIEFLMRLSDTIISLFRSE